ncbi:leucine-rich repeat-containing protein 18 isoform X2 [Gambusia affinis]|uniref:leucine-rich repeat-containing protein 18 isoform X2 n=1 Tax=Gambusia affinis TaxID=33528 RepID=UPI001CDB83FC|nr:leucine-rich repeat-containing protein 18 isoform X2 [Gambusia affinis]
MKKGGRSERELKKLAKKAINITQEGKRRLIFSKMGLITVPRFLIKMRDLNELDLSRNQIQKLPEAIGTFTSLTKLDLHSNKLESLPESIGSLVGLTHLNLANNCLTTAGLPSSLGFLCNLTSLNLGLNQIDALPSTLEQLAFLQELALFDNCFTEVPEFVPTLQNLIKLNLERNPYAEAEYERIRQEKLDQAEELYLVHENNLCKGCIKKCKAEEEGMLRNEDKAEKIPEKPAVLEEKRNRFEGLMTPNSVAAVTQDVWRIREKE